MEKLAAECRRLEREKNITAYIRPASKERQESGSSAIRKTISVEGFDQAGIVYRVSSFLAESGINIRTLGSEVRQSPQSGGSLYSMTIHVDIPEKLSLQKVEEGLSAIGDRLNVDVTIR
jgi:glycine cleavage system transcriptional repressor